MTFQFLEENDVIRSTGRKRCYTKYWKKMTLYEVLEENDVIGSTGRK